MQRIKIKQGLSASPSVKKVDQETPNYKINKQSLHQRVMSWFSLGNSSTEKETRWKTIMSDDSVESINEDFIGCNHWIPESKKT